MTPTPRHLRGISRLAALLAIVLALGVLAPAAHAQRQTSSQRVVRGYVPPDELVSFPENTSMSQFFRLINPTFFRVTGKRVVDPQDRADPIGIALNGVHFIDAFELVLDRHELDFNESESYFIVTEPEIVATTTDGLAGSVISASNATQQMVDAMEGLPATADTREIRIDAVIFELNTNRAREVGTNWAAIFGEAAQSGGSGGTGGTSGEEESGATYRINGSSFFDALDGFLEASSDRIEVSTILNLFRYFEDQGYGQTIASPFTTVQSGQQGQLQSGQDIPVTIKDFSGNTINSFIQTGTIISVTPTLIIDERSGDPLELIHLNVKVEKSQATPSGAISKNNITTQLPLLSGEMRALGGLTSTEESSTRRGVPVLRDLPLLSYFFSYKQTTIVQKELVVVLMARVVDDLRTRNARPNPTDLLRQEREDYRRRMDDLNPGAGQRTTFPDEAAPMDLRTPPVSGGQ
jgi:type IV pilus assembly protein PilQ